MNRTIRNSVMAATLLSVAACGSFGRKLEDIQLAGESNIGLCPNAFVLADADRMIEFNGEPSLQHVAWSAEIVDVRTSCRYAADRPIQASVEIDFAVGRGPAAEGQMTEIPYFVAVTRKNKALIAKSEYAVPVRVKGDIATVRFTEDIKRITIPRKDSDLSGGNFEIAVGLGLTKKQVIFNRSGQSLKFPTL